jgi:hypothetical protein
MTESPRIPVRRVGSIATQPYSGGTPVRESAVKPVGKPDALIGNVRFDERGWETGRRSGVSARAHPRLYTSTNKGTAMRSSVRRRRLYVRVYISRTGRVARKDVYCSITWEARSTVRSLTGIFPRRSRRRPKLVADGFEDISSGRGASFPLSSRVVRIDRRIRIWALNGIG